MWGGHDQGLPHPFSHGFQAQKSKDKPRTCISIRKHQFAICCELCFPMDFKLRNQKTSPEPAFQFEKTNSPFLASYVFPWISSSEIKRQAPNLHFNSKKPIRHVLRIMFSHGFQAQKSKDKPRGLGTEFFFFLRGGMGMGPGWGGPPTGRRHGATRP